MKLNNHIAIFASIVMMNAAPAMAQISKQYDDPTLSRLNIDAVVATFNFLFDNNNASALGKTASTYCIDMPTQQSEADPPPALLRALAKLDRRVKPQSMCRMGTHVTDNSGRPALTFSLTQLQCRSKTDCLFYGGYLEGNLSASSGRYRSRLVGKEWQVIQEGPIAIS